MDKLYIDNMFKTIDENIVLDDEQKEVILDESKNLIVIAGAGTGKTTTISAKVKYLVEIKKINPKEILIISFTNKAINELKSRINIDFNIPVVISTFHKLAYDMLKSNDQRYMILNDSESLIKKIILNDSYTKKIIKILRKNKKYKKYDNNYVDNKELLMTLTCELIQLIKILNINLNKQYKEKITTKYVEFLKNIMFKYNEELENNMYLDFEDLLIKASELESFNFKYKYIIVDEYQDVSINKLNFLRKIVNDTGAKTIVVGDDFQTIFSFAGSQINLFLKYQKMMNARLLKITKTYRNSQELIDVAGELVMKNDQQIKKQLKSIKRLKQPIEIYGYKNNFYNVFEKILKKIINGNSIDKTILILGRYKSDINLIKSRNLLIQNNRIVYLKNPKIKIDFLTIHASKGLGYDNVILINFNNEYKGFPSNIENIFLKKEIIGMDRNLEEERRLFYVALTRTKNKVYILTKIGNESEFIYDIYNNSNVYMNYKFIIKKKYKHKIR